ncbi:helix-turn-helix domain-containing protein [Kitasatospora purpeofusca]|uniref:helix-turn-helix domain-containing protein n=1 Tax=Kitasatospora purpeofusca TaxID=67352 RepID=UPI0038081991
MATGDSGTGTAGRLVADNLRRLREARGLSLRALAEQIRAVGGSLSADAINKIENGRTFPAGSPQPKQVRRVDTEDLVVLADALNVSPLDLLLPPRANDEPFSITGERSVASRTAWQWALGQRPAVDGEPGGEDFEELRADYIRLSLPRELRRAEDSSLVRLGGQLEHLLVDVVASPGDRSERLRWVRMAQRRLGQIKLDLEEVEEVLSTGDDLDDLKRQHPGLISHVKVTGGGTAMDVSRPVE